MSVYLKMKESGAHKLLKKQAKRMLKNMGFNEEEIFEEFSFHFISKSGTTWWGRVDVAGIKGKKRVAVECGRSHRSAWKYGYLPFDKLIFIPYLEEDALKSALEARREFQEKKTGQKIEEVAIEVDRVLKIEPLIRAHVHKKKEEASE